MRIEILSPADLSAALPDLTEILHQTVHHGASVGFILPFEVSDARAFWTDQVFPAVERGTTQLFVARGNDGIVGTAQLGLSLPSNQKHRADVMKLLVHPNARRQGIGRLLMQEVLDRARTLGKDLLVLDTRSGDPSQSLYQSLGFKVAGQIPGFCRNPRDPILEATTYMYKTLAS
jgi:ribosomal protein S18 acetylase RimI-like enzyme